MATLFIKDVIGDSLAVTSVKGDKVFDILKANIENNEETTLDFEGITDLISAFSNLKRTNKSKSRYTTSCRSSYYRTLYKKQ